MSDPGRHRKALDLAYDLRNVSAADREDAVADACGSDRKLAHEVLELLDASDRTDGMLGGDARVFLPNDESGAPPDIPGYRIEDEVGRGGMGIVYRAADLTNADRTVALKILPPLKSDAARIRFADECGAMARLVHPNIAVLYQSGIADERPFVAMEYIDGARLDHYADENALGLDERLRLIRQVCRAITYAHERGILHQDIKPANLLVTRGVDGEPTVKVIDFGIATLMGSGVAGRSAAGSPAYVSPERAEDPMRFTADTREDVFALGVVLFEVVTGIRPTLPLAKSAVETIRSFSAQDLLRLAQRRRLSPRLWKQHVAGDLDAIIGRALETVRERRYRSPADLAADLFAYAEHRPVSAREATAFRTAWLFAQRRWPLVLAIIGIIGSLAFGLVTSQMQAQRAERALAESEQVTEFVAQLFAHADAMKENPRDVNAIDILDRGYQTAQEQLADRPIILGRVLEVIGTAYGELGELDAAASILDRSLTLREDKVPDASLAAAWLQKADAHRKLAEFEKAQIAMDRAESIFLSARPADGLGLAAVSNSRANMLFSQSNFGEAEALHRRALELRSNALGPDATETGVSASNVGGTLIMQRKYSEAEYFLRDALRIFTANLAMGHAWTDRVRTNLAASLNNQGRHSEAFPLLETVLKGQIRRQGENHPELIPTLTNAADSLRDAGRFDDARHYLGRALAVAETVYTPPHPEIARVQVKLAGISYVAWELDQAIAEYETGLEMYRAVYGQEHRTVATQMQRIGRCHLRARRPDAALLWLDPAAAMLERLLGADHYATLSAERDRLSAHLDLGRVPDWTQPLLVRHESAPRLLPRDRFRADILAARVVAVDNPGTAAAELESLLATVPTGVAPFDEAIAWAYLAGYRERASLSGAAAAATTALALAPDTPPARAYITEQAKNQ